MKILALHSVIFVFLFLRVMQALFGPGIAAYDLPITLACGDVLFQSSARQRVID